MLAFKRILILLSTRRLHPGCRIDVYPLELSSIASVREFVSEVAAANDVIDIVICNAGLWTQDEEKKTKDGFEMHFGVNYLAHFEIATGLIENLKKSGKSGPQIYMVFHKSGPVFERLSLENP